MKFSTALSSMMIMVALVSGQSCEKSLATAPRCPIWQDYVDIEGLIFEWVEYSECKKDNWDWNQNLQPPDCEKFPKERNPRPLASRLIRHAFHDAAGKLDGYVHTDDEANNGGLDSSQFVLDDIYNDVNPEIPFSLTDGGYAIKQILTKADFAAWSYIAALRYTAFLQDGTLGDDGVEAIPNLPVRYGRADRPPNTADHLPHEDFPTFGSHSVTNNNANQEGLVQYFDEYFGLTAAETTTLLGAHTLGGARVTESGHAGMWTQSKNRFNIAYYQNLIDPIPMECSSIGNCKEITVPDNCRNFAQDEYDGRCHGWELREMMQSGNYQWSHSCTGNTGADSGCAHIMLHADMSLVRDIDDYVCLDKDNGCGQYAYGEITGYPLDSPCANDGFPSPGGRIFAKCFHLKSTISETLANGYAYDSDGLESFIDEFALVFDKMISGQRVDVRPGLELVGLQELPKISNGQDCDSACVQPLLPPNLNPYECIACQSGKCSKEEEDPTPNKCRPKNWTP